MSKKGITVQVRPEVAETLQRLAEREGVSISKIAAEFLETGLNLGGEKAAELLLLPKLEKMIRHELSGYTSRVATLLARTTIDAGVVRRMVHGFISVQAGADIASKAEERARREAVIELKNKGSVGSVLAKELARALSQSDDIALVGESEA